LFHITAQSSLAFQQRWSHSSKLCVTADAVICNMTKRLNVWFMESLLFWVAIITEVGHLVSYWNGIIV